MPMNGVPGYIAMITNGYGNNLQLLVIAKRRIFLYFKMKIFQFSGIKEKNQKRSEKWDSLFGTKAGEMIFAQQGIELGLGNT